MSTVKAAIVACLLACLPGALLGFDQPPAGLQDVPIKIYATGSFLGQFDGMMVYPAHSRDTNALAGLRPYGGLLGAADWLGKQPPRGPRDLLLVAGDNFAHGFARRLRGAKSDDDGSFAAIDDFWRRMDALQPTAVGIWSEDFYRALAPPSPTSDSNAGRLAKWLAGGNRKLLASNAAVRLHRKRLNQIKTDDFELEIERDSSLGWNQALSLSFDCEYKDISYELRVKSQSSAESGSVTPKGKDDPCHGLIEPKKPLRPGTVYELSVRAAGRNVSQFSFETDRALTPFGDGEPAVVPQDPALPIVVGFVDPAIRKRLPQENWEWTPSPDAFDCRGEKCEIIFHEPSSAFAMIRGWLAPYGERYFAMLAGVTDADATALLTDSDAIRFVVLPADSGMLGLGAAEREEGKPQVANVAVPDPPYAGDWGNFGILDGNVPPAARAWVRVQWMGANAPVIEATVSRRDPDPAVSKEDKPNLPEWDVTNLKATSVAVIGYRMCAEAAAGESIIRYKAAQHGLMTDPMTPVAGVIDLAVADRYPVYAAAKTYNGRNEQGNLWVDASDFAAMTLDRMRDALHAEIAIFPYTTVDDDYIAYLAEEQKKNRALNWLSREVVKRALFRADRAVRVKVEGSKLADVLGKIVANGPEHCAAGLGDTSCKLKKIDAKHLRVNGRKVQPDHYYGIAMLAGMAAEFGFEETRISESLIDLIDASYTRESGPAVSTCTATTQVPAPASPKVTPLADRLENDTVGAQAFYLLKPFGGEFSLTELSEPDTHRNRFSSLPLSGSKVADQVKWALDGGANLGVDWRGYALYGTGTVKYGKTRVQPHDQDRPAKAIDPDEYRVGARFDIRRWITDAEGRIYTGVFQEGELSREVVFGASSPWPEPSNTRRRRYRYVTAGAEVDDWWSAGKLAMKQVRAAVSHGTSYAERQGIRINGGDVVLLTKSLTTLLEEFKTAQAVDVDTIEFDYIERRRTRGELAALFELPLYETHGRNAKLTLDTKYFFYRDTKSLVLDLVERHHAQAAFEATFPAFRVLDFGLKVENQRVWLRDGSLFSVFRSSFTVKWPLFGKKGAGIIW